MNETAAKLRKIYRRNEYTFAADSEARIARVEFTDKSMMLSLDDGRVLTVPLAWIPTLANATRAELEAVELGQERASLHWTPRLDAKGRPTADGINEDLRLADLL